MQYVRSISGSVSKTWNSINPATLSGAIDVIVVELEDGTLACSPFHVRFGKFSLLRPYEKKVEFRVNGARQDYAMKLGEEGEAFFVFETSTHVPAGLQTSPLVSPAASPGLGADGSGGDGDVDGVGDVDFLDLGAFEKGRRRAGSTLIPVASPSYDPTRRPSAGELTDLHDRYSEGMLPPDAMLEKTKQDGLRSTRSLTPVLPSIETPSDSSRDRSKSPPPLPTKEAIERAAVLSEKLSLSNIRSQVTDTGDLMLDMTGYKSSDDDALRAEAIARKILSEELAGNYDIGALIGVDEQGRTWIYSSEEAKEEAAKRAGLATSFIASDAASDPGYHSDGDSDILKAPKVPTHHRSGSDVSANCTLHTPPPDPTKNFAKTLRLTSDQLKALSLKPGANSMSFTVNRATCQAYMYLWRYDVPIVISDIDGTITKSDALGHVLNMIGRDWTHIGVAKLYTEISSNGYNIMYLTSRSVGQADTTRAYLNGVVQEGYRLPKGPTIMSPDRTIAALRRELYIRKPEVFKMACLRDIKNLFGPSRNPFYGGFGNRFTDALSYRSVSIPQSRIFTINSYAEVSLDLLSLNKRYSYVDMREVVDHYFPPVTMRVQGGGEEFTDYMYWREPVLDFDDFTDSEDEAGGGGGGAGLGGGTGSPGQARRVGHSDDEDVDEDEVEDDDDDDDDDDEGLGDSYVSRESFDAAGMTESFLSGGGEEEEEVEQEEPHEGGLTGLGIGKGALEREAADIEADDEGDDDGGDEEEGEDEDEDEGEEDDEPEAAETDARPSEAVLSALSPSPPSPPAPPAPPAPPSPSPSPPLPLMTSQPPPPPIASTSSTPSAPSKVPTSTPPVPDPASDPAPSADQAQATDQAPDQATPPQAPHPQPQSQAPQAQPSQPPPQQPPPHPLAAAADSHRHRRRRSSAVEVLAAEVITGMKGLSVEMLE